MRKSFVFIPIVFCLLASACAPVVSVPPAASIAAPTASPTRSPTLALTVIPSPTPAPARPTHPPTWTNSPIPKLTPTFDARSLVTATPGSRVDCPKPKPDLQIKFPPFDASMTNDQIKTEDIILNYLNQGGTFDNLLQAYNTQKDVRFAFSGFTPLAVDITNDGVPEILAAYPNQINDFGNTALHILVCNQGIYTDIFHTELGDAKIDLLVFKDLNGDGVPEVTLITSTLWAEVAGSLRIYEWDGNEFRSLISAPYSPDLEYRRSPFPPKDVNYRDFIFLTGRKGDAAFRIEPDQDGLFEIRAIWKHVSYSDGPSRDPTLLIKWNGRNFMIARVTYPPPQFRFQAIQDADDAARHHEFDTAISLYQEAIFNSKLDWYSEDRQGLYSAGRGFTPVPDPSEYPRLAAYAYYRLVILHTFLNQMDAAQTQYTTLQAKFPAGSPGHPYAEMAAEFRNAYQPAHNMAGACNAAIQYAAEHPDLLTPLGSEYHGQQSTIYTPGDVCPFR